MALSLVQQQSMTLNHEALSEWIEYREFKKKPLSQFALDKTVRLLERFDLDQQQRMVDAAIMNDWRGLHEVDKPKPTAIEGDTSWLSAR